MICLHCGKEFDARAELDDLGWHTSCTYCTGSFDVDIKHVLLPIGTQVDIPNLGVCKIVGDICDMTIVPECWYYILQCEQDGEWYYKTHDYVVEVLEAKNE